MKYLVPIDLSQNELENPRMHNLASAPSSPVVGQFYFNTANAKAYVWNGTRWVAWDDSSASPATATPSMDGTAAVGTSAKYAREDHVHPSDTTRVPTSRKINTYALTSDITLDADDIMHPGYEDSISHIIDNLESNKVDKETGKGLSTNDYTTTEKNKLAGIASGAEVNVQSDWNQTTTSADDYIKNKPTLGAAAAKGVDTSISSGTTSTNLPTSKAVDEYVGSAISASDAMIFKGGIAGTSTSPGAYTPAADCGHTYRVTTGGYIDGIKVEAGDILICNTDNTAAATSSNYTTIRDNWVFVQANIDGAITSISGTAPISVTGSGSSRTVSISAASGSAAGSMSSSHYTKLEGIEAGAQKNPTYTAVTGKPTGNKTPGFGGTFTISQISQAANGQISATDRTVTIPSGVATTAAAGLMSSTDKSKLNGLPPINVTTVTIPVGSNNISTSGITPGNEIAYTAVSNNEEVIIDKTYNYGNIKFSTADNVASAVTIQVTYLRAD